MNCAKDASRNADMSGPNLDAKICDTVCFEDVAAFTYLETAVTM